MPGFHPNNMRNLTKLTKARYGKALNFFRELWNEVKTLTGELIWELWDDYESWNMRVHMELWDDMWEFIWAHENYESHMRVLSAGSCASCQDL